MGGATVIFRVGNSVNLTPCPQRNVPTVLLVNGGKDSREIYGAILKHNGFCVLDAEDAVEGLRLARAHLPDVLIREHPMMLPDGSTLSATLKADPATASIQILTVTARVMPAELAAAYADHSARVVTKPLFPAQIVQHVRELLQGTAIP